MKHKAWAIIISILLAACTDKNFAPVSDANYIAKLPSSRVHIVKHGETLYEIAWKYGLDYRDLAQINSMSTPYILFSNQSIKLRKIAKPLATPVYKEHLNGWLWPAKGPTHLYGKNGLYIYGKAGDPVVATLSGKVVYSGNGLKSYGNLIILKHNSSYLSAYAHNRSLLVKEGDWVNRGQKIAEMGDTGTNKVMLYFEIRKAGLALNPLKLLSA